MNIQNEVTVVGSGPAGLTAAIYCGRANLKPVLFEGAQKGGQLMITTDVENYPGFCTIQGPELMDNMHEQAINCGAEIINSYIKKVDFTNPKKLLLYSNDNVYESKAVIIATGAQAKWLGLESEKTYMGRGVSGCATCDGAFFRNEVVIVIGGGNTAVEEALYLTKYASKVFLLHRRDALRAEKVLQDRLFNNDKIECIWNAILHEVVGLDNPKRVTGIKLKYVDNDNITELPCTGVFIAIGHKPNTDIFQNQLAMDSEGYIITSNSVHTSAPGVFAAGDVHDKTYRQAVTAAGYGCMAALEVDKFLHGSQ